MLGVMLSILTGFVEDTTTMEQRTDEYKERQRAYEAELVVNAAS